MSERAETSPVRRKRNSSSGEFREDFVKTFLLDDIAGFIEGCKRGMNESIPQTFVETAVEFEQLIVDGAVDFRIDFGQGNYRRGSKNYRRVTRNGKTKILVTMPEHLATLSAPTDRHPSVITELVAELDQLYVTTMTGVVSLHKDLANATH